MLSVQVFVVWRDNLRVILPSSSYNFPYLSIPFSIPFRRGWIILVWTRRIRSSSTSNYPLFIHNNSTLYTIASRLTISNDSTSLSSVGDSSTSFSSRSGRAICTEPNSIILWTITSLSHTRAKYEIPSTSGCHWRDSSFILWQISQSRYRMLGRREKIQDVSSTLRGMWIWTERDEIMGTYISLEKLKREGNSHAYSEV